METLRGSYLSEMDRVVRDIQAGGGSQPLVIRYRWSTKSLLVGQSDASFQNSGCLGQHQSESWSKAMKRVAEIENNEDLSEEERDRQVEDVLNNQETRLKPLLSFVMMEVQCPSKVDLEKKEAGADAIDLEACLYSWSCTASNYVATSSYQAEGASLARFAPEYLFIQSKLSCLRIYLSLVYSLDNCGLVRRLNRRSGIKDASDFRHVCVIKQHLQQSGGHLAFVSDRLMIADFLNKKLSRKGHKYVIFNKVKSGWLRVWQSGDKRGTSLLTTLGTQFQWERF